MKRLLSIGILCITTLCQAEFNLEDQTNRPAFVQMGYRKVLDSFYQQIPLNIKNINDYKQKVYVYNEKNKQEFEFGIKPKFNKLKKLEKDSHNILIFDPYVIINKKLYELPIALDGIESIGGSIIYDDNNITIFTLEFIKEPNKSSSNRLLRFKSIVYIVNKNNAGIYMPVFLDITENLEAGGIPNRFSSLNSVKYNKNGSYDVLYEIYEYPINEKETVEYEKNPMQYYFNITLNKNKNKNPFVIKKFIKKRKNSNIISRDDYYGMDQYYLNFSK